MLFPERREQSTASVRSTAALAPIVAAPLQQERETRRRRRWWIGAVLVFLVLLGADVSRPPREQWSAKALVRTIRLYQATLSPMMPGMGVHCRFIPTCSHYGEAAIEKYGALAGTARTVWRVLRCGPWTEAGTVDPP